MEPRLPDGRTGDRTSDDWLAEQGEVDWSGEPSAPRRDREPASAARGDAAASPDDWAPYDPRRLTVVQRRRAIALVVLLALVLAGVVGAVALLREDGVERDAPTAPPPATTQPPPTQPPATTAPAVEPLTITLPESGALALGATGEEVETLQTALAALELDPGPVDGDFGAATEEAVRAFQQANDLPVDGIVGAATAEKLNAVLAAEGITG